MLIRMADSVFSGSQYRTARFHVEGRPTIQRCVIWWNHAEDRPYWSIGCTSCPVSQWWDGWPCRSINVLSQGHAIYRHPPTHTDPSTYSGVVT